LVPALPFSVIFATVAPSPSSEFLTDATRRMEPSLCAIDDPVPVWVQSFSLLAAAETP
jgi:hypothetical protein